MIKNILLILAILLSGSIFAQEHDRLVSDGDTINLQIKIDRKKGENEVYFRKSYENVWHAIYAENASAAFVGDKSLYLSIKLPGQSKNVWSKCFFYGAYKLVGSQNQLYIIDPDGKILGLRKHGSGPEEKTTTGSLYVGQFIALLGDKIDYDYRKLVYDPKSFVKPLILYHKVHNLRYHDYNHYVEVDSRLIARAAFSEDKYKFRMDEGRSVKMKGNSFTGVFYTEYHFPKFSNRLFFSTGLESTFCWIKDLCIQPINEKIYYIDVNYQGVVPGIPVNVRYEFFHNHNCSISLEAGVKFEKAFPIKKHLRTEIEEDGVVNTELPELNVRSSVDIAQNNKFLVDVPIMSKIFSFGVSWHYSLMADSHIANSLSPDESWSFFAGLNF